MKYAHMTFVAGLVFALFAEPSFVFSQRGRPPAGRPPAPRGVATGPIGGVQSAAVSGSTVRGPGGTTVQRVGGTSVSRGPLGTTSVSSGSATRVTGPAGNSVTRAQGGTNTVGPAGGVRVSSGSGTAVRTPTGSAAAVQRSNVAVGPAGGVRTNTASGTAVRTPFGTAATVSRSGVAVGPTGNVRVGHTTQYMSPNAVHTSAVVVRSGFRQPVFTPVWFRGHPNAWVAPRWRVGVNPWRPVVWVPTAAFIGIVGPPIVYDYGSRVVIENNVVYVNGDRVATADDYATQAIQYVVAGRQAKPTANEEWQPLGVFGLIRAEETTAQRIFQLAVNKDGVIRGNYYDVVSDNDLPIYGSVDKKSQRVAWSIGEKKDIVFETGLSNFSKDESTVLVHYGKENTQQMILVRLEEPKDGK